MLIVVVIIGLELHNDILDALIQWFSADGVFGRNDIGDLLSSSGAYYRGEIISVGDPIM
jgi:hypothetical protein